MSRAFEMLVFETTELTWACGPGMVFTSHGVSAPEIGGGSSETGPVGATGWAEGVWGPSTADTPSRGMERGPARGRCVEGVVPRRLSDERLVALGVD